MSELSEFAERVLGMLKAIQARLERLEVQERPSVGGTVAGHSQVHSLVGPDHSVSGLTPGDVLTALTTTTFGFAGQSSGTPGATMLHGWLTFGNQSTPMGTLPQYAIILNMYIDVRTAFDSGGTDYITVGYGAGTDESGNAFVADPDAFVTNCDVSTTGLKTLTRGAVYGYSGNARPMTATYTAGGTAPTTGLALVVVEYAVTSVAPISAQPPPPPPPPPTGEAPPAPTGPIYYVDKEVVGGSANGTSWANAWSEFNLIDWAKITPGTTILVAGRATAYTTQLSVGASGTSATQKVIIRKVAANDPGYGTVGNLPILHYGGRATQLPVRATGNGSGTFTRNSATQRIKLNSRAWVEIDGTMWDGWRVYGCNENAISANGQHNWLRYLRVNDNGYWNDTLLGGATDGEGVNFSGRDIHFEFMNLYDNGQDEFQCGVTGDVGEIYWTNCRMHGSRKDGSNYWKEYVHADGIQIWQAGTAAGGWKTYGYHIENCVIGPGYMTGVLLGDNNANVGDVTLKNSLIYETSTNGMCDSYGGTAGYGNNWRFENVTVVRPGGTISGQPPGWLSVAARGSGNYFGGCVFLGGYRCHSGTGSGWSGYTNGGNNYVYDQAANPPFATVLTTNPLATPANFQHMVSGNTWAQNATSSTDYSLDPASAPAVAGAGSSLLSATDLFATRYAYAGGTPPPAGGSNALDDEFTTADAAPLTAPRTCEPGPGTLSLTQVGNSFAISGGQLLVNDTMVLNDGLAVAFNRSSGRACRWVIPTRTTVFDSWKMGLATTGLNATSFLYRVAMANVNEVRLNEPGYETQMLIETIGANEMDLALVCRSTGCYVFGRNGLVGDHTLLWVYDNDSTASLYFKHMCTTGGGTLNIAYDNWLVGDYTDAAWTTQNGLALFSASSPALYTTLTGITANHLLDWTFTHQAVRTSGMDIRRTDNNNKWLWETTTAGLFRLRKVVATVWTTVYTASVDNDASMVLQNGTTYTVKTVVSGTRYRAWVNNTLWVDYTDGTDWNTSVANGRTNFESTDIGTVYVWPRVKALPAI